MIKVFNANDRREIDSYTIENEPISSIDLMERAAWQCSKWIMMNFSRSKVFHVFCGKGNNGGDGFAIARHLAQNDYRVSVYCLYSINELSNDANINFQRLSQFSSVSVIHVDTLRQIPFFDESDVIIDAIFGSGLTRNIDGFVAQVIEYINNSSAIKIAIDIPSGLPGNAEFIPIAVHKANYTLTFQFPFLTFFLPEYATYVGNWVLLDIGLHKDIINSKQSDFQVIEKSDIRIIDRPEFAHKNTFGHALIIAGSEGMAGAALLCSKACISAGCGLVTTHVPKNLVPIIQTYIPEVIASIDKDKQYISSFPDVSKYNAIAFGPGIGTRSCSQKVLIKLIKNAKAPLVIDADGLNIISQNKDWLKKLPVNTILTPHPGEFDRLFGKCNSSKERVEKLRWASKEYQIIIVLKGRYTIIADINGVCYINPTGNVGMATAGSGDVLTGIITSLLAQGYQPLSAAIIGVYLHGAAGDWAANLKCKESVIASDIIHALPEAFKSVMK